MSSKSQRRVSLTATYELVEDGWTQARFEELPAVITAAPTIDEARVLLLDALHEYLMSLVEADEAVRSSRATREIVDLVLEPR